MNGSRDQARMLGITRAVIGAAMVVAPGISMRAWTGESGKGSNGRLLARAFGVREIALGTGLVIAIDRDAPVRGWLEAGVLCDTADTLLTLASYKKLPRVSRTLVLMGAAGAAVNGAVLARKLDTRG